MAVTMQELWALIGEKDCVIYELRRDILNLQEDFNKVARELVDSKKECDELKDKLGIKDNKSCDNG